MFSKFVQGWLIAFALLENVSAYSRYIEIPGENRTHLVDLQAEPRLDLLATIRRRLDINNYLLFTRKNQDSAHNIVLDDEQSVKSSNFDPAVMTAVVIHGWQSSPNRGIGSEVTKALLEADNVNVIVVDWRKIALLDYVTAVIGVPVVGENIGALLEFLNRVTGAPYSNVHLLGHSLGAHVAGNAGRSLNGQVARITGLDPAGPLWNFNKRRLSPSNAIYVEAIHTNGAGLGIESDVADVDFYVNGGSLQPGCTTAVCHHGRSYKLFASSIAYPNRLVGAKCSNFLQMAFNLCNGSKLPLGNNDLHKTGKGIYRVNTKALYPY